MKPPGEVYFVDVTFSPAVAGNRRRAGVKGGRLAKLEYALERRKACLEFDPDARVRILRSETVWHEVPGPGFTE